MTSDIADNAARLPYRLLEGGEGPPMFLVHGMLSSHRQWTPNLASLRRQVRPVLFDLWGHGDAPCPLDDRCFDIDYMLGQFELVRRELGADRILLCGQSLGACFTLRYAIEHPQHVIGQVFTNSVSALSPADTFGTTDQRRERAAVIEAGGREALAQMPFHPSRASRLSPALREDMVAMAQAVDPRAVARLVAVTGPRLSVRDQLHQISCPTLLVNGLWEKAFQPLRTLAAERIAGCRVADVEAGHAVNLERPGEFDAAVSGFLQSLA